MSMLKRARHGFVLAAIASIVASVFVASPAFASGKPSAPARPSITTLNDGLQGRAVRVTWQAPSANGHAITEYRVTVSSTDGGGSAVADVRATTRSRTFSVTNGKHYRATVAARNSSGWGRASAASSAVMPYGQASRPRDAKKVVDKDRVSSIRFDAPVDTGGLTIMGYEVSSNGGPTTKFSGTSGDVPFDSNNGPYTATITPLAAGPDGTVRGKPTTVSDLRPYGQPGEPDGSASPGYRSVSFTASQGASNGRAVTGVQMNCEGSWENRSSCSKSVNQGGDQACVSARTVGEDNTQSSERRICGNSEPRHVTVSFVSISPTEDCASNCKRINVDVDGFAGGQYTVTVNQPGAAGADYPSHSISVGSDGKGQVHDYWYTGYPQTVVVTVDGVTGSGTP